MGAAVSALQSWCSPLQVRRTSHGLAGDRMSTVAVRADRNNHRKGLPSASMPTSTTAPVPGEATMEEHVVWMTTRQIKPGTLAGFELAWRGARSISPASDWL